MMSHSWPTAELPIVMPQIKKPAAMHGSRSDASACPTPKQVSAIIQTFLMANETKVTPRAHYLEVESLALLCLIVSAKTS